MLIDWRQHSNLKQNEWLRLTVHVLIFMIKLFSSLPYTTNETYLHTLRPAMKNSELIDDQRRQKLKMPKFNDEW